VLGHVTSRWSSGIGGPASVVRHRSSGIGGPASVVRHRSSGIHPADANVQSPGAGPTRSVVPMIESLTAAQVEESAALLERALFEVKKVIVGQDRMVERLLVCLLARGHCLLEGVPGLAKTLAAETLAATVKGTFARVQFTPDLMPSDLVGTRIYRPSSEQFDTELGPIFANFVLADEINRAPAKVQSALLEVMAERHVSIAGVTHRVPDPFLVLATQNPIESEGVYALPEAQRDRFLLKVHIDYPTPMQELEIVRRMGIDPPRPDPALKLKQLLELQHMADAVYVDPAITWYAVSLVFATRVPADQGFADLVPFISFGASPRATLGLVAGARALALIRGRTYVLPQDVYDLAPEVLRHRVVLSYEALADGIDPDVVIDRIITAIPIPRITPAQGSVPVTAAHGLPGVVDGAREEPAGIEEPVPDEGLRSA
jgi:MoxR-like ATPase